MGFLDDYEPVEDRLRAFWSDHPEGRIETEVVYRDDAGAYIVKASLWRDHVAEERPSATGLAEEHMTEGHRVNETWPLENCETSAIGRALANLGYAPKGKRPSREEMSKARVSAMSGGAVASAIGKAAPSDRSGEGAAGTGDAGSRQSPSPGRPYPFDPAECRHRFPSGRWLRWDEEGNCPRCGTPKLIAMESTTADLGPA